jgi:hypothetical protein
MQWTYLLLATIMCYYCLDIISQRRLFHACNLPYYSVIKSQVCQPSFTYECRDGIALRHVFLGNTGQRPQFYACAHDSSPFKCRDLLYGETYILSLFSFMRKHIKNGSSGEKFLSFVSINIVQLAGSVIIITVASNYSFLQTNSITMFQTTWNVWDRTSNFSNFCYCSVTVNKLI